MKKTWIVALLVVVNVALVAALVLHAWTPEAKAQVFRGAPDYLVITGRIGTDWDALYIIDLKSRKLGVWRFDKTQKKLVQIRGRLLKDDFGREKDKD